MNRIEIEIMSPAAARTTFLETWKRASTGEPVTPRVAFGSYAELFSTLSERRFELLRYVASHPGLDTRQLAFRLERSMDGVCGDTQAMSEIGLLEQDPRGFWTAPYDEIVIRADLTQAA